MNNHWVKYKELYVFIALSYLISWGSLLFGNVEYSFPWFLAKFGFSLSAVIVLWLFKDKKRATNIIKDASRFRAIYMLIGALPLLAYLVSILILVPFDELSIISNQTILDWGYVVLISPASGILFYSILRGGLGEEIGLRGFAIPFLAEKHSLIKTALIIGVFWALWHYPVWIPSGMVNLIVGTIATIAWSGIFTYAYAKTRSIGLVILLHATGNAADDIFEWMLPGIIQYDWEVIYILIIVITGLIAFLLLKNTTNPYLLRTEENHE